MPVTSKNIKLSDIDFGKGKPENKITLSDIDFGGEKKNSTNGQKTELNNSPIQSAESESSSTSNEIKPIEASTTSVAPPVIPRQFNLENIKHTAPESLFGTQKPHEVVSNYVGNQLEQIGGGLKDIFHASTPQLWSPEELKKTTPLNNAINGLKGVVKTVMGVAGFT